ncbi:MAG: hypothetical protein Q4D79_14370 [Propionibacteriaceae bacterium]|nr:hypothetical protein [Propionibacteriaceae bacterium]
MLWTRTGTGYELTIRGGKIVARNDWGRELTAVPAAVKNSEEQLE